MKTKCIVLKTKCIVCRRTIQVPDDTKIKFFVCSTCNEELISNFGVVCENCDAGYFLPYNLIDKWERVAYKYKIIVKVLKGNENDEIFIVNFCPNCFGRHGNA